MSCKYAKKLRKHPTDALQISAVLSSIPQAIICWVSRQLKALKTLDFLQAKNHKFSTQSVYYVEATGHPLITVSKSAEIVLTAEAEKERFRRPQEQGKQALHTIFLICAANLKKRHAIMWMHQIMLNPGFEDGIIL